MCEKGRLQNVQVFAANIEIIAVSEIYELFVVVCHVVVKEMLSLLFRT
jgi:hypothetical protein